MSTIALDAIDRRILDTLQEDSSLTNVKLAEKVGLSPSPCLRRVRILEDAGIIERYVAVLDHEAVGLGMTAFIEVRLDSKKQRDVKEFEDAVAQLPEVLECHIVAGDYDYLLRVVLSDMTRFRQFIMNRVLEMPNIASTRSSFSVGEVKRTTKLPLTPTP